MTHDERETAEAAAPRPRARLIDVAHAAGVSPKTVSRVINDESGVLPDTRERVQAAVRDLGFVPDRSARALKRREADTVGILIDAIENPRPQDRRENVPVELVIRETTAAPPPRR